MSDEEIKELAEQYIRDTRTFSIKVQDLVEFAILCRNRDNTVRSDNTQMVINLQAENERLRNPWKDAEKEKPEKVNKFLSVPVLCRYTRGGREYHHVSQYDYDYKQWQIGNVTHWMYIPEGGES